MSAPPVPSGEMLLQCLVRLVRRMRLAKSVNASVQASAARSRSLKEGRFAPGIQQIQTRFRLAVLPGARRMHVKAIRATIDLRCSDLHEFHEAFFESVLEDTLAIFQPRLAFIPGAAANGFNLGGSFS